MGAFAATLATISAATYSNSLAGLPGGFTPLPLAGTVGGVFVNANAAASVTTGVLDGQSVVVLSFRGSDDRQDWLNNLRNINADYPKFAPLIAAVEQYALQNNLPVVVTGHSLGAGLAQVFMSEHPESGPVSYQAVTFGSPGALISAALIRGSPVSRSRTISSPISASTGRKSACAPTATRSTPTPWPPSRWALPGALPPRTFSIHSPR